ncbi:hypothetical protein GCM10027037_35460 [Mucilaginibacter koreensis]
MIKPVYFTFIFAFLFALINISNVSAQSTAAGWSAADEKELYTILFNSSKQLLKEDAQRQEWANCSVAKLKIALPKGISSVSQDSVFKLANQIGASCVQSIKNPVYLWSPMLVERIKLTVLNRPEMQIYKDEVKSQLVDCLLAKLQKQFPDGFTDELIKQQAEKLSKDCIAEISLKKP